MILLDTNVLSALMRAVPDPSVVSWLDSVPVSSVWIPVITIFEVRHGLELLSAGRRRRALEEAFVLCIEEDFEGRILAFDRPCAEAAGRLGAQRSRLGRTVETRDLQLAGMALARRATLATHNTRHFQGLGIELVDPWAVR